MAMEKVLSALAVSLLATVAVAQEESESAEAAAPAESESVKKVKPRAAFATLPQVKSAVGTAEIRVGDDAWVQVEEGRRYSLRAAYRTAKGGKLVVDFGGEALVSIEDDASFATRMPAAGEKTRTVVLTGGTVTVKLPENMPEGAFVVTAPGFTVRNPAGESRYAYENLGDGDKAVVRCVTGAMSVDGRHFRIPAMRAANEFVIRSGHDGLSTRLDGTSGDYVVMLDQGIRTKDSVGDDGTVKKVSEKAEGEWHLSPATMVVINRSVSAIGERMSVHTMAFDAAGERKSECCFCEGRAELNSGELVPREKSESEDLAKRAAEATEAAASDAEDTTESSGNSTSEGNEE